MNNKDKIARLLVELNVFREKARLTPYDGDTLDSRIDEMETEMSNEALAAHYGCAVVNWGNALDSRDEIEAGAKKMKDALRNVRAVGTKMARDTPYSDIAELGEHLLGLCEEAGVVEEPLRASDKDE